MKRRCLLFGLLLARAVAVGRGSSTWGQAQVGSGHSLDGNLMVGSGGNLQILLGDLKTVVGARYRLQPVAGALVHP